MYELNHTIKADAGSQISDLNHEQTHCDGSERKVKILEVRVSLAPPARWATSILTSTLCEIYVVARDLFSV